MIINRQTYGLLDWLSDIGGLVDAFYLIGQLFVSPVVTFALRARLLSSVFRYRDSYIKDSIDERRKTYFNDYFKGDKK